MKLDKIYKKSKKIEIDKKSKIVIMSDCHRGIGNINDNFSNNKLLYKTALEHYNKDKFTYIELGDGDDMWEVKKYDKIIKTYPDIFKIFKEFYKDNRLIMIFGNHDICKKSKRILKKYFYQYYDKEIMKKEELLNHLEVNESLVLVYNKKEIFLIHGHQVDFFNSSIWKVSRFLVRHIWKHLESIGIKAPNNMAKNYEITNRIERKLKSWSIKNNKILISGHTHHAIYPKNKDSLYFNDGSCIHLDGITCLEIENGEITLVKWYYEEKNNKILVKREAIEGKEAISTFYNNL